jgi:hypothetical protein
VPACDPSSAAWKPLKALPERREAAKADVATLAAATFGGSVKDLRPDLPKIKTRVTIVVATETGLPADQLRSRRCDFPVGGAGFELGCKISRRTCVLQT